MRSSRSSPMQYPQQPPRWLAVAVLAAAVLAGHAWLLGRWPRLALGVSAVDARDTAPPRALAVMQVRSVVPDSHRPDRGEPAAPARVAPALDTRSAQPVPAPAPAAPASPAVDAARVAAADTALAPAEPPRGLSVVEALALGLAAAPAASEPPPIYPTQPPAPVVLRYQVSLGTRTGEAVLRWLHDGQRYRLQFDADAAGFAWLSQVSTGSFDEAGLAPDRFVERRQGRGVHAANFQRDHGHITFSGPRIEHPAWPGAQDRLGWIAQLAAISQAAGGMPPQVTIFVVDAYGFGGMWTLDNLGQETVEGPRGPVVATRVMREAQRLADWRVEAWLDPSIGHWPVRLRLTVARTGMALEWRLAEPPASP